MSEQDRKAAVAAYKERKVVAGIYTVRCAASEQCWVGRAPDVSTIRNRLWFTLRNGSNPHRTLQAAWGLHGADAFRFEVIEQIEEEEDAYIRDRLLKGRLDHWLAALQAERI